MNAAKRVMALLVPIGLLVAAGCNQNQQKVQELEGQVAELTQEDERLFTELVFAKSLLEEKEAELAAAKEAHAQASNEAAAFKKELAAVATEVTDMKAQFAEAEKKAPDAEQALAELKAAHEKSLGDAQAAAAAKAQAQINALTKQVADLTKKLEEARKELAAAKEAEKEEAPPPETP